MFDTFIRNKPVFNLWRSFGCEDDGPPFRKMREERNMTMECRGDETPIKWWQLSEHRRDDFVFPGKDMIKISPAASYQQYLDAHRHYNLTKPETWVNEMQRFCREKYQDLAFRPVDCSAVSSLATKLGEELTKGDDDKNGNTGR